MVIDRERLLLCFIVLLQLTACQANIPSSPPTATETAVPPNNTVEAPPSIAFEQARVVEQETVQAGRTVNGRIVTGDGSQQPVPAVQLRLEPGGESVTETVGDGRFTLRDLPFTAVTVFADHFQFTIPAGEEPTLDLGDIEYPLIDRPLTLENYPPSETPYRFGSFWLVHTPEGQLMAFSSVSPEYKDSVSVEECQFVWAEVNRRFTDPCSGDEWELNGRLNLEHSGELWSNRNLDQYHLSVMDGQIFVQFDRLYRGLPVNELPLASDSQFGVTMTVTTADFSPTATNLTTLTQVDPLWGMNPTTFPPQQALTYPTFPDSFFDNQQRTYAPEGGQGGLAVFDPGSGGMQQNYHLQWAPLAADAQMVTITLTINLREVPREVTFQPDLADHQEGDVWPVDMPLEIGHAVARMTQLEWLKTVDDGRIRLRLTVEDDSPEGIGLQCLYLSTTIPEIPACTNFSNNQEYVVIVPAEEPAMLHLRAGVELLRPFTLVLHINSRESTTPVVPDLDAWSSYDDPELDLAFRYPPNWTITKRDNGLTLTAPQTAVVESETVPWTIWVSERPKFAEDASLFDVIVNEYHFPNVIEQFEATLTEETINGRTAYRSTIIPAIGGQQTVFFEDGDRFIEVTLRPFDREQPHENQEAFAELLTTFLETIVFSEE
ncbi:MAG: hypothetical protein CL608_04280 [Anaerolineaceae bacterium]|nr:hypothetical protein [Anaerolineaceae bacterium]